MVNEMLCPPTSPARELQDFAGLQFLFESRFDESDFVEPRVPVFGPTIVPALPQEPLVVLSRAGSVVLDLLQEGVIGHLVKSY